MRLEDFSKLFSRNAPPVHVLIELRHPDGIPWRFTSDNRDVTWRGNTYKATAMKWRFPETSGGVPQGGAFEITVNESAPSGSGYSVELMRWFDMADDRAEIVAVAVINDGEITELEEIVQRHGSANRNGKKITWNPSPDDRFLMHVNPWELDSEALLA